MNRTFNIFRTLFSIILLSLALPIVFSFDLRECSFDAQIGYNYLPSIYDVKICTDYNCKTYSSTDSFDFFPLKNVHYSVSLSTPNCYSEKEFDYSTNFVKFFDDGVSFFNGQEMSADSFSVTDTFLLENGNARDLFLLQDKASFFLKQVSYLNFSNNEKGFYIDSDVSSFEIFFKQNYDFICREDSILQCYSLEGKDSLVLSGNGNWIFLNQKDFMLYSEGFDVISPIQSSKYTGGVEVVVKPYYDFEYCIFNFDDSDFSTLLDKEQDYWVNYYPYLSTGHHKMIVTCNGDSVFSKTIEFDFVATQNYSNKFYFSTPVVDSSHYFDFYNLTNQFLLNTNLSAKYSRFSDKIIYNFSISADMIKKLPKYTFSVNKRIQIDKKAFLEILIEKGYYVSDSEFSLNSFNFKMNPSDTNLNFYPDCIYLSSAGLSQEIGLMKVDLKNQSSVYFNLLFDKNLFLNSDLYNEFCIFDNESLEKPIISASYQNISFIDLPNLNIDEVDFSDLHYVSSEFPGIVDVTSDRIYIDKQEFEKSKVSSILIRAHTLDKIVYIKRIDSDAILNSDSNKLIINLNQKDNKFLNIEFGIIAKGNLYHFSRDFNLDFDNAFSLQQTPKITLGNAKYVDVEFVEHSETNDKPLQTQPALSGDFASFSLLSSDFDSKTLLEYRQFKENGFLEDSSQKGTQVLRLIEGQDFEIKKHRAGFSIFSSAREVEVVLKDSRRIKPGIYKVTSYYENKNGTLSKEVLWFSWGLVSVNTEKPLYRPNETANLKIVVLDKNGFCIDGAKVELTIIDPSGKVYSNIKVSASEETGVYDASFDTKVIGEHKLLVKAYADGVKTNIESFFNVVSDYDFDIIRKVPVTIDPWRGPFTNEFKITSFSNLEIKEVVEILPVEFKVINSYGGVVNEMGDIKTITWKYKNESSEFKYTAQAPFISPYLYELGNARIIYKKGLFNRIFVENRTWLFALDPLRTSSFNFSQYASDGHYACEKGGDIPSDPSDCGANALAADYAAINLSDNSRWDTSLATSDSENNSQMFFFKVDAPHVVNNFTWTWEGYYTDDESSGSDKSALAQDIYIWNESGSEWVSVYSTSNGQGTSDNVRSGSISTNADDFVWNDSGDYYVVMMVTAEHDEDEDESGVSCPFVFSWNGSEYVYEHEGYPFSVIRASEAISYERLNDLVLEEGYYNILLGERLDEVSYTNNFNLRIVEHPKNTEAIPDLAGNIHTVKNRILPVSCKDIFFNSSCLLEISEDDGVPWVNENLKEFIQKEVWQNGILLKFPENESKQGKLVLHLMKTGLMTKAWIFYVDLVGYNNWKIWQDIVSASFLGERFNSAFDKNVNLRVETWNGEKWVVQGQIKAGLEDWTEFLIPVNLSENKEIRIVSSPGFYQIDSAYIDYSEDENINIHNLEIDSAITDYGENVADDLKKFDKKRVTLNKGDNISIKLKAPEFINENYEKTAIVSVGGYYNFVPAEGFDISNKTFSEFIYGTKDWILSLFEENYVPKLVLPKFGAVRHSLRTDFSGMDINLKVAPEYNYSGFNISSGSNIDRGAIIRAYAFWNYTDGVSQSKIEHDGTGSKINYTISTIYNESSGSWTNYTIDTSNRTEYSVLGRIDVYSIYAQDKEVWGATSNIGYFYLWDFVNLSKIQIYPSTINETQSTEIKCRVINRDTGDAVSGYRIYFFDNSSGYLGNSLTNSSGWANYSKTYSSPNFVNITCNISDSSSLYLKASSEKQKSSVLQVLDSSSPLVYLEFPEDSAQDADGNVTFNFNVTDSSSEIENCSITIDSNINKTITSVQEGITQNFTVWGLSNGNHLWNVSCFDKSDNENRGDSSTRTIEIVPDTEGPDIQLLLPPNSSEDPDGNVTFTFKVNDSLSGVASCELIVDEYIENSSSDIEENVEIEFYKTGLFNGLHYWQINCTDDSSNQNHQLSQLWQFSVTSDSTPPEISLFAPVNNSKDTDGNVTFVYQADDYASGIENCSLYLLDEYNQTSDSVSEATNQTFFISSLDEGNYYWFIECFDDSSNQNSKNSTALNFTVNYDFDAPTVSIYYPENKTQDLDGVLYFNYSVSDENDIANCSLILNDTIYTTDTLVSIGDNYFYVDDLAVGEYYWNVNCTDLSDSLLTGYANDSFFLKVSPDYDPPEITLISPLNDSKDTDGEVIFRYIVNDVFSGIDNCKLILNNEVYDTDNEIEEGVYQTFSETLSQDNYTWSINCTDDSLQSNNAQSEDRVVSVELDFEMHMNVSLERELYAANEIFKIDGDVYDGYDNPLYDANASLYIVKNLDTDNATIAWFDSGFEKRKEIVIENLLDEVVEDVSVNLTLDTTSSDIVTGCTNVRFADHENNLLNHFLVSGSKTSTTKFLVKLNRLLTGNNTIAIYYKNTSDAPDYSSKYSTTPVYDDFEDNNFNTTYWYRTTNGDPLSGDWDAASGGADSTSYSTSSTLTCDGNFFTHCDETKASFSKSVTLSKGGYLSFYWGRTSTTGCTFEFLVDGQQIDTQTSTGWNFDSYYLTEGSHTIKWEHTLASANSNRVCTSQVDQIFFYTNGTEQRDISTEHEFISFVGSNTTDYDGEFSLYWNSSGSSHGNYSVTAYSTLGSYWSPLGYDTFILDGDIVAPELVTWNINVSNGAQIKRGGQILAYSEWTDNIGLDYAYLSHNGTGTQLNYSIGPLSGTTASANYTLNTSDLTEFSNLGMINVSAILVNDTSDNWAESSPSKYFYIYSSSEINESGFNNTNVSLNDLFTYSCHIRDEFDNHSIFRYNVSFYKNSELLGTNLTNSSGWAVRTITATPGGSLNISCEINDSSDLFYEKGSPYIVSDLIFVKQTPTFSSVFLNATSDGYYEYDNLSCEYHPSGGTTSATIAWFVDSIPMNMLNMDFEGGEADAINDYSGYGNDATPTGVEWNATGGLNGTGAFEFNGDSDRLYINSNINTTDDFSIEFWFKLRHEVNSTDTVDYYYIDKPNDFAIRQLSADSGRISVSTYSGEVQTNTNQWLPDTWYHIVVVYLSSDNVTVFVNGAADNYNDDYDAGIVSNDSQEIYIGEEDDGDSNFNGTIDSLRWYDRALSFDQVRELYLRQKNNVFVSKETVYQEEWQCKVTPFSIYEAGSTTDSNSENISSNAPAFVSKIECENDGTWKNCTTITYGGGLTRVRVNCTGLSDNASIFLFNNPDYVTLFNGTVKTKTNGWYIYNNYDLSLWDSGQMNISASCYGPFGNNETSETWNYPWGTLTINISFPQVNATVVQGFTSQIVARVSCLVGECGDVNATLNTSEDGLVSTSTSTTPFYSLDSNPQNKTDISCLTNMAGGLNCSVPWILNSSGNPSDERSFYAFVTPVQYIGHLSGNTSIQRKLTITSYSPLSSGQIQCEESSSWKECSELDWAEKITRMRINCTAGSFSISNATFILENIEDSKQLISGTSFTESAGWWVFDNDDLIINDSGTFNLTAVCYDNRSISSQNSTNWFVDWGWLNVTLIYPDSVKYVEKYNVFNFTTQVQCIGGECGDVSAQLNSSENGIISTSTSATPFYTLSENPRNDSDDSCLSELKNGTVCSSYWLLNATGSLGNHSLFSYYYSLNYSSVLSNESEYRNITIYSWAKIDEAYLNPTSVGEGDKTTMYCRVEDNITQEDVSDYWVLFYNDSVYMGSNLTGSDGYAQYSFNPAESGMFTISCNISSNSTLYYNASESNFGQATLAVGSGISVYDFSDTTYNSAYEGTTNTTWTEIDDPYSDLTSDNNVYQDYSAGSGNYAFTRFEFKINESEETVTLLNVTWAGYGDVDSGTDGFILYLYNDSSKEWVEFATYTTDNSEQTEYIGVTANLEDWINDSKYVKVLAKTYSAASSTSTVIATDFIQLVVWYDIASPNIDLIIPEDYYNSTSTSLIFNCSVSDDSYVENVSLYGDWNNGWHINLTNYSHYNNYNYTFNVDNFDDGTYNWNCYSCDKASNCAFDTFNYTFTIDTTPPEIVINVPSSEGVNYTSQSITFNVSLNEAGDTCLYSLDNGITNITMNKDSAKEFSHTNDSLTAGQYNVSYYCNDSVGNLNATESRKFGVTLYDFYVSEIEFNDSTPEEGQNILVIFHINNSEAADAVNVSIMLNVSYWNDSAWELSQTEYRNVSIAGGSGAQVNFSWVSSSGTYQFAAYADDKHEFTENDETNNVNYTNYSVSGWGVFYGYTNGTIILANSNSANFSTWLPTIMQGNLYFADYDSSIDFTQLEPLNDTNDFEEADSTMNMTAFNDSIKRLFDSNDDDVPDNLGTFIVYDKTITQVPFIKSTNTSSFVTGLLWDSSDGGSQYNGTQDLVFITVINDSKAGKYGVYDYEIKIPSKLQKYTGSNDWLSAYMELTS